jgi:DNA mismatch repair protein MSH6
MDKELEFFRVAFDHQQAAKEGTMIPRPGVDKQYDQALERIASVQAEAEKYLLDQKRHFGGKVSFVGTDKKRFQLEVSETAASRADRNYELQGQRKVFKRYYTPESRGLIQQMLAAD